MPDGYETTGQCWRVSRRSPKKSVVEPEDEGQADAEEEGGHQWRIELEPRFFYADIARQAPNPAELVGDEPQYQASDNEESAKAHEHFAEIFHGQALS